MDAWMNLKKMLEKIHFSDNDMLYIIGDVVDRGPRPIDATVHHEAQKYGITNGQSRRYDA